MQTIVILLNPDKLKNPDMDLAYCIPKRIEEVSNSMIQANGHDFLDVEEDLPYLLNEEEPGTLMGIWLNTESASENWSIITDLFQMETFKENDLLLSAKIYISKKDTADIEDCIRVFPI